MESENENPENISLLRLQGKLDFTSATEFEQKFNIMLNEGGQKFILDFSDVEYMSSAGLRFLLIASKKTKGNVVLCSVKDSVKQVIEIAGFASMFNFAHNQDQAVEILTKD
ncbi:MAG: STAS domain-containing protein [Candidatus Dadabacteria bacterium]|nr:STAS domain-containing protein [Candidatus Dadabacteria bacterium]NIV41775.1 anti-sigma factor antagonist [Candidatus Dadabacteria bacterium]NIX14662.1 anti-sigma factor antagonist [Candidatus Dadabacteria bacterium]